MLQSLDNIFDGLLITNVTWVSIFIMTVYGIKHQVIPIVENRILTKYFIRSIFQIYCLLGPGTT